MRGARMQDFEKFRRTRMQFSQLEFLNLFETRQTEGYIKDYKISKKISYSFHFFSTYSVNSQQFIRKIRLSRITLAFLTRSNLTIEQQMISKNHFAHEAREISRWKHERGIDISRCFQKRRNLQDISSICSRRLCTRLLLIICRQFIFNGETHEVFTSTIICQTTNLRE